MMTRSLDSDLFRNLGHPTRLKVVEYLIEGEKNVGELLELVGEVQQGRLSSHLA